MKDKESNKRINEVISLIFKYINTKIEDNGKTIFFSTIDYYSLTDFDMDLLYKHVRNGPFSEEKLLFEKLYKKSRNGKYLVNRESIEKMHYIINNRKISPEEIDMLFKILEGNNIPLLLNNVDSAIVRFLRGQQILPFKTLNDKNKNFVDCNKDDYYDKKSGINLS